MKFFRFVFFFYYYFQYNFKSWISAKIARPSIQLEWAYDSIHLWLKKRIVNHCGRVYTERVVCTFQRCENETNAYRWWCVMFIYLYAGLWNNFLSFILCFRTEFFFSNGFHNIYDYTTTPYFVPRALI